MLITRPRSASGAESCIVVLHDTTEMMPKNPVMKSTATAGQNARTSASPMRPQQASAAAATISARGGRRVPRVPRVSAPLTAPTPSAAMRKPKPSAPRPSMVRTTRGT
jgi:hypothetical protein